MHRWQAGAVVAALLALGSAADAQVLRCTGDLVFEDSMARHVTLFVDPDEGSVKNPACHKYPELRGFCAGVIGKARDHEFVFGTASGTTVSEEDSKLRIELIRTNGQIGTASVLNRWPRVTFLGRCAPNRIAARRRM